MPRRSIAGAELTIWETFSSRVIRETRSFTRSAMGNEGLRYGDVSCWAPAGRTAARTETRRATMQALTRRSFILSLPHGEPTAQTLTWACGALGLAVLFARVTRCVEDPSHPSVVCYLRLLLRVYTLPLINCDSRRGHEFDRTGQGCQ